MYCSNCGVSVPEGIKYCPKCGASIVTLDSQQTQHQSPATRTYDSEPCAQNVSYARPQPERRNAGMAPSVLSLVFGIIALIVSVCFVLLCMNYQSALLRYSPSFILLIILFSLPAFSLAIVGLVKGINNRIAKVIVLSAIGLVIVFLSYALIILPFAYFS